jgi:preprotein translocase SecE subunit
MSVAEKPITEVSTRSHSAQLALGSLFGSMMLLFSLWLVLAGIPLAWNEFVNPGYRVFNEFLSAALLMFLTIGAAIGLGYLGLQAEKANYAKGLREGAIVGALFLYVIVRITFAVGNMLHRQDMGIAGMVITAALGLGLVFGLYKWFSTAGFAAWLGRLSDSGWFEPNIFKGNQGVKIRRITVIAILALGFWGIITTLQQRLWGVDRETMPNNWYINIPFTGEADAPNTLPLMFKVHLVAPILLALLLMWLAWRVVNVPAFADFLIATEAEMNKVSWTSRKRLMQDTVVVLTTMILMTLFLFIVDIIWIKVLSSDWIWVLQVDTMEERQKLEREAQW